MKLTIFALVLLLVGCGGGNSGSASVAATEKETTTTPVSEEAALYGVWRGRFESEYNGFADDVTVVFAGDDAYLMNYDSGTAVGMITKADSGYVALFSLYKHYPVSLHINYKTPYLGRISGKTLEVSFNVDGNEVVAGRYTEVDESAATDVGSFSLLKQKINGSSLNSVNEGLSREFSCGTDGGSALSCYSRVNVIIKPDGSLHGEYSDSFGYQDRFNIPLSIPSSQSFDGRVDEIEGTNGLFRYSFFITEDSGQGHVNMEGVGWDGHFIAVSTGERMAYTFSDFRIY